MEFLPVTSERKAQLEEYAQRHGKETAAALDEVIATYLNWESQDYSQAVEGIREGLCDMRAGRVQDSDEVLEELRLKHGLSG